MSQKNSVKSNEQYAIPTNILCDMASVCAGDTKEIYQLLLKNYKTKNDRFRISILEAWHYLAWSKMTGWKTQERKKALKKLKKIKKAATTLDDLLPRVDFSRLPPARSLEEYLYRFLSHDNIGMQDDRNYEKNLDDWHSFQEELKAKIECYNHFERYIHRIDENLRPRPLAGLTEFIYQIAILYTETTGKKFTVDKLAPGMDGMPKEPLTEGMMFANKSLEAIYCITSSSPHRFTPENFQNACDAVSKRLKESE